MKQNNMNLTVKDLKKIEQNLRAFTSNFDTDIRIEKSVYDKQYYVFLGNDESYKFFADDINSINGWLYGCVQTKNGIVK